MPFHFWGRNEAIITSGLSLLITLRCSGFHLPKCFVPMTIFISAALIHHPPFWQVTVGLFLNLCCSFRYVSENFFLRLFQIFLFPQEHILQLSFWVIFCYLSFSFSALEFFIFVSLSQMNETETVSKGLSRLDLLGTFRIASKYTMWWFDINITGIYFSLTDPYVVPSRLTGRPPRGGLGHPGWLCTDTEGERHGGAPCCEVFMGQARSCKCHLCWSFKD